MHFRREKLPPAAGDKALVGSWVQPGERIGVEEGKTIHKPAQRVEIFDGYLFAHSDTSDKEWIGGKYTVDTTKNPKWIDVELVGGIHGDKELTKLHGCYEVADGQLKIAFGTTGKRVLRPLELKPSGPDQVLFFDVKATKEPLIATEKVLREDVSAQQPKTNPKPPASGNERMFRVPEGGMTLPAIARLTLGTDQRWEDIYKLNPNLKPSDTVPAGTAVKLPPDARNPG